jgi:thioredoxin 1
MSLLKEVYSVTQFEEVIRSKGVLVDFYAKWCAPCQSMMALLEDVARTYSAEVWKVDIDRLPTIPQRYKIRSIPTLMVFSEGESVGVKAGAMSRGQLFRFTMDHSEYLEDPFNAPNESNPTKKELQRPPKDGTGVGLLDLGATSMPLRGAAG